MKAILQSVKPKWVEKILKGEKTVEVRKSKPSKIVPPFRVYLYCTLSENDKHEKATIGVLKGKIIGEYICDLIQPLTFYSSSSPVHYTRLTSYWSELSCLSEDELYKYAGKRGLIYCWHITELLIYKAPKELSDFYFPTEMFCEKELCGGCPKDQVMGLDGDYVFDCEWKRPLKRAPQSWCYVEDLGRLEMPEWISVRDQLPPNELGALCPRCLVNTNWGVTEGWYNPDVKSWYVLGWFREDPDKSGIAYAVDLDIGTIPRVCKGNGVVTHWRPLPERCRGIF